MPQRPCALPPESSAGAAAATGLWVAVGVTASFLSRVATTGRAAVAAGRAAGFDAGGSFDVNGSPHLPPRRAGAALVGLPVSAGAARRVPVDLRSPSENGSFQSPDDDARLASRLDGGGG